MIDAPNEGPTALAAATTISFEIVAHSRRASEWHR